MLFAQRIVVSFRTCIHRPEYDMHYDMMYMYMRYDINIQHTCQARSHTKYGCFSLSGRMHACT